MQKLTGGDAKRLGTMLTDLADVVEAYLVHGDVDLQLWVAKARHAVAKAEGDRGEESFQARIIKRRSKLVTTGLRKAGVAALKSTNDKRGAV